MKFKYPLIIEKASSDERKAPPGNIVTVSLPKKFFLRLNSLFDLMRLTVIYTKIQAID